MRMYNQTIIGNDFQLSDKSNRELNEMAMKSQDKPLNEFFQGLLKKKELSDCF